jgi:hypothetical protein
MPSTTPLVSMGGVADHSLACNQWMLLMLWLQDAPAS